MMLCDWGKVNGSAFWSSLLQVRLDNLMGMNKRYIHSTVIYSAELNILQLSCRQNGCGQNQLLAEVGNPSQYLLCNAIHNEAVIVCSAASGVDDFLLQHSWQRNDGNLYKTRVTTAVWCRSGAEWSGVERYEPSRWTSGAAKRSCRLPVKLLLMLCTTCPFIFFALHRHVKAYIFCKICSVV